MKFIKTTAGLVNVDHVIRVEVHGKGIKPTVYFVGGVGLCQPSELAKLGIKPADMERGI